jgi:hypothetical protein
MKELGNWSNAQLEIKTLHSLFFPGDKWQRILFTNFGFLDKGARLSSGLKQDRFVKVISE